jgi:Phospholipase_D-nuclease N-terminal
MLAATFGAGQVAYSLLWFFLFVIEIWLMISVFIDIFRSHDLRGWAKAAWVLLVLVFPLVGILAYLIARGDKMRAHQVEDRDALLRSFVQQIPGARWSDAQEIARLEELRREGVLSETEFERLKRRIIEDEAGGDVDGGAAWRHAASS